MSMPNSTTAEKVVDWLFREGDLTLSWSESLSLFSAMMIINSPKLQREFFNALANKITAAYADESLDPVAKDSILYNALSYLTYANPQEDQTIHIKGIKYGIEKIALTSGWISAPYYAYGLKALDNTQAPSYLIFQGTTVPTDHGFLAGVLADTCPFGAIGAQLYTRGQARLQAWIQKEHDRTHQRVICTGQSLGGAMSMHAHIHQPDLVDFFSVNPPSLTRREQKIYEKNRTQPDLSGRMLSVLSHVNDPVYALGSRYFPPGTTIYKHGEASENSILAHAKAADCRKTFFQAQQEPHTPAYGWKIMKFFLFLLAIVLLIIAWPIRLLIKAVSCLFPSNPQTNDDEPSHAL